jgi:hypothetical protein
MDSKEFQLFFMIQKQCMVSQTPLFHLLQWPERLSLKRSSVKHHYAEIMIRGLALEIILIFYRAAKSNGRTPFLRFIFIHFLFENENRKFHTEQNFQFLGML